MCCNQDVHLPWILALSDLSEFHKGPTPSYWWCNCRILTNRTVVNGSIYFHVWNSDQKIFILNNINVRMECLDCAFAGGASGTVPSDWRSFALDFQQNGNYSLIPPKDDTRAGGRYVRPPNIFSAPLLHLPEHYFRALFCTPPIKT